MQDLITAHQGPGALSAERQSGRGRRGGLLHGVAAGRGLLLAGSVDGRDRQEVWWHCGSKFKLNDKR